MNNILYYRSRIKSLWPSGTIGWLRFKLVFVKVIVRRHQANTRTNVDLSSVKYSSIYMMAISWEILQPSIIKISLKITYLKFHSNVPGASELIWTPNCLYADNFSKYDTQEEMMEGRARLAAQRTWGPPGPPGPPPPHGPPGPPGPHGPMPPGPHGPPPRGPMEPWVGEPVAKRGLLEPPRPGGPPAPPNWAEEPAAAATARQGGSQPMGMGMALSRKVRGAQERFVIV